MLPVVFDTSAIFAALTSDSGASRQLLYRAYRHENQAITSDDIIDEATRNLSRKAPRTIPYLEQILAVIDWQMVELPDALVLDVSRILRGRMRP